MVEPKTKRSEVVVAPPKMVRPVLNVPPPIVEVALAMRLEKLAVPVKEGEMEKTRLPVPVVPVTEESKLAAVIVETKFLEASVATRREAVRPETLALVAKRSVEKKSVVVPLLPVKAWRVVEPFTSRDEPRTVSPVIDAVPVAINQPPM